MEYSREVCPDLTVPSLNFKCLTRQLFKDRLARRLFPSRDGRPVVYRSDYDIRSSKLLKSEAQRRTRCVALTVLLVPGVHHRP